MKDREVQDVIEQLKGKLYDYLIQHNITIENNKFSCINHGHEDKHPSCSLGGRYNKTIFHCFSCSLSGNIFTAAHYLEKLPIQGPEFFTITLDTLAKRYGIKYTPKALDQTTRENLQLKKAYDDAAQTLNSFVLHDWNNDECSYVNTIKDRGINRDSVVDYTIGCLPSVKDYEQAMLKKGWSEEYLLDNELLDRPNKENKIFDVDKIILPIKNINGEVVAFVSRKANWKGKEDGAKYVNSRGSSIYKKSKILYGLDLAKDTLKISKRRTPKPLHIVEGYIDVITLRQHGIKNVAGLGSAALNPEIFDILGEESVSRERYELQNVILAFDGDETGIESTRRAIEDLQQRPNIKVKIKKLPKIEGYKDPDEIIKNNGVQYFKDIEEFSTFKWLVMDQKENNVPEMDFVKTACADIANYDSPIDRVTMSKDLSDITTMLSAGEVKEEVDRIRGNNKEELRHSVDNVIERFVKRKKTSNTDVRELLGNTLTEVNKLYEEYTQQNGDTRTLYEQQLDATTEDLKTKKNGLSGFRIPNFPMLEKALDGYPKDECFIGIPGPPNTGKSTLVRELSWDIAVNNPDALVIYMSIDDSLKDCFMGLAASEIGESRDKLKKYYHQQEEMKEKIDYGIAKIRNQINYIVCDSTMGNTFTHLTRHLEYAKKKYPGMKPIIFLDNFHKVRGDEDLKAREKFSSLSQSLKDLSQIENVCITTTVELRKGSSGYYSVGRPRPLDEMSDTRSMSYDFKVVLSVAQMMHEVPDTKVCWLRTNYGSEAERLPYLEYSVIKNKHTSVKKSFAMRFEPDRSILRECPYDEFKAKIAEERAR